MIFNELKILNFKGLSADEKKRREIALAQTRKMKAELFSLWCNELYRLSIANHVDESFLN